MGPSKMKITCPCCNGSGILMALDIPGLSSKSLSVYLAVKLGWSYRAVGRKLGISSPSVVQYHYRRAKRFVEAGSTAINMPSMPVCPNASVKWSVCDCRIKSEVNSKMSVCDGKGSYTVIGNMGYQYSYPCNKVSGKPAHVG
jgi:hypothetical protein